MKKILLFALMVGLFVTSNAQTAKLFTVNSRATGDTLNDADTLTKVLSATAGYNQLTFGLDVKKISGTVAGTISITASADNGATYGTTLTSVNDTLTNTTGTKQYNFAYSPVYYDHYKITVITSGTVSAKLLPYWNLKGFKQN